MIATTHNQATAKYTMIVQFLYKVSMLPTFTIKVRFILVIEGGYARR